MFSCFSFCFCCLHLYCPTRSQRRYFISCLSLHGHLIINSLPSQITIITWLIRFQCVRAWRVRVFAFVWVYVIRCTFRVRLNWRQFRLPDEWIINGDGVGCGARNSNTHTADREKEATVEWRWNRYTRLGMLRPSNSGDRFFSLCRRLVLVMFVYHVRTT